MSGVNFNVTSSLAGTGSGGGTNYGSSELSAYTGYADAAAATPVDMTGGSPTTTLTSTTSTPLRGASSLLITKDAANRQGEGFADAITVDDADKCKVLTISFDYEIASGTYADGDLTVYVYDVTNSTLIQPAGYSILNTGIESKHIATFQTTTSTSYRWGFHVASTSASAYTVKIDNVIVGPQVVQYGAPITDWISYTPTLSWAAGVSGLSAKYRRVGDVMEGWVLITCNGAVTATGLTFTLPSGHTADTAKFTGSTEEALGHVIAIDTGTNSYLGTVVYSSATTLAVRTTTTRTHTGTNPVDSGSAMSNSYPFTFGNTDQVVINFKIPIAGWSSNVQMSNDTDARVCAAQYYVSASTANSAITAAATEIIDFDTKGFDTHGAVTTGASWKYTVQVPGYYRISATAGLASVADAKILTLYCYKNGTTSYLLNRSGASIAELYQLHGSVIISLVAGDYVDIRLTNGDSSDRSLNTGAIFNHVSIERLSGPSAIAASETVTARYSTSAGNSIGSAGTTIIDFATKDYDSHGAVTTGASWKFTAPISGVYEVDLSLFYASASITAASTRYGNLRKNGSAVQAIGLFSPMAAVTQTLGHTGTGKIRLLAGDYIDILGVHNEGTARSLAADATLNWVTITRVGNY